MMCEKDIAIIVATVTASTQDFRWQAQSILNEIEGERKDQGNLADTALKERNCQRLSEES